MNSKIEKIAKKAGFIFWGNETYGPGPGHIDWASNYDEELEKFVEILKKDLIKIVDDGSDVGKETKQKIFQYFDK